MNGGASQFARVQRAMERDLAAEWSALGAAIEQHGRDIDAYAEKLRERRDAFNRQWGSL